MTYCITSRRGTSKLLELVPNPFDDINKICSKQTKPCPLSDKFERIEKKQNIKKDASSNE